MNMLKGKSLTSLGIMALVLVVAVIMSRDEPVPVEVAVVERGYFHVTVDEQGRTRARNPYIVAAPINGRLLRTALEAGDEVMQGEVMAEIALSQDDPRTRAVLESSLMAAEARLAATEADLTSAEGELARARREEERRGELFKQNLVSAEERDYYVQFTDTAEARANSIRAAVAAAAAEVESARSRLLDADNEGAIQVVRAPSNGTVYRVFEESERVVLAGTPLFQLSNDDSLEIVTGLLTQDAVQVSLGDRVMITGWGGNETLSGVVTRKEPEAFTKVSALGVEEQRVNIIIGVDELPPGLGAEYRVETSIIVWEGDNELTVPGSALFQRQSGWHVFVVENGIVALRQVETGLRGRTHTQVLSGLAPGETVVLFPSDLVEQGTEVAY
jgi:HlyD family secretion protein